MKPSMDEIFDMLSCNNDEETQKIGIAEAEKLKYLSVFLRPVESKSLWENCAKVLAKKEDDELQRYAYNLLEWLQDMNWPGAYLIYDRLKCMSREYLYVAYCSCLKKAVQLGDSSWEQVLRTFDIGDS